MNQGHIYFQDGSICIEVTSLFPAVRYARRGGVTVTKLDPIHFDPEEFSGYLSKGITDPITRLTTFGFAPQVILASHAVLAANLPQCAKDSSESLMLLGGVNWFYFAQEEAEADVLAVTYSQIRSRLVGPATSLVSVVEVICQLARHGLPEDLAVAVVSEQLRWDSRIRDLQRLMGLLKVADWVAIGPQIFKPIGDCCPVCGEVSFDSQPAVCRHCGASLLCATK